MHNFKIQNWKFENFINEINNKNIIQILKIFIKKKCSGMEKCYLKLYQG